MINNSLGPIRLRDFQVFREVARAKSIREVARRLALTPGQVSKTVQALEKSMKQKLFKRSAAGVLLTDFGTEILSAVDEIVDSSDKIEGLIGGRKGRLQQKIVAIAGTSFLTTHFTTPVVCADIAPRFKDLSFRFLDLPPDQLVPVGLRGGFEIASHFNKLAWPKTWISKQVGRSEWALCVRERHPLGKNPKISQVLEHPFVVPTYWTTEGLVRGDDAFTVPFSKRKLGFESATAEGAIPILLNTDHIAYLPTLMLKSYFASGQLRRLKCADIETVEKSLFLSARADLVSERLFSELAAAMGKIAMR